MKINIELNKESLHNFFEDVFESGTLFFEGAFPLKLDGKEYEHFFDVNVDLAKPDKDSVKVTCKNVFERHLCDDCYEDLGHTILNVELSEQERMLFRVGCDAYLAGKYTQIRKNETNGQKEG